MKSPIERYLAGIPAAERRALERIRRIVMKAYPAAQESAYYGLAGVHAERQGLRGISRREDALRAASAQRHRPRGARREAGRIRDEQGHCAVSLQTAHCPRRS